MNKRPTMLLDLIGELNKVLETQGNVPVAINGYSFVYVSPEPFYYDGGAMLPMGESPNGGINWLKSRNLGKTYPTICHLNAVEPDGNDVVNGEILPTTEEYKEALDKNKGLEELCIFQEEQIKKGWNKV